MNIKKIISLGLCIFLLIGNIFCNNKLALRSFFESKGVDARWIQGLINNNFTEKEIIEIYNILFKNSGIKLEFSKKVKKVYCSDFHKSFKKLQQKILIITLDDKQIELDIETTEELKKVLGIFFTQLIELNKIGLSNKKIFEIYGVIPKRSDRLELKNKLRKNNNCEIYLKKQGSNYFLKTKDIFGKYILYKITSKELKKTVVLSEVLDCSIAAVATVSNNFLLKLDIKLKQNVSDSLIFFQEEDKKLKTIKNVKNYTHFVLYKNGGFWAIQGASLYRYNGQFKKIFTFTNTSFIWIEKINDILFVGAQAINGQWSGYIMKKNNELEKIKEIFDVESFKIKAKQGEIFVGIEFENGNSKVFIVYENKIFEIPKVSKLEQIKKIFKSKNRLFVRYDEDEVENNQNKNKLLIYNDNDNKKFYKKHFHKDFSEVTELKVGDNLFFIAKYKNSIALYKENNGDLFNILRVDKCSVFKKYAGCDDNSFLALKHESDIIYLFKITNKGDIFHITTIYNVEDKNNNDDMKYSTIWTIKYVKENRDGTVYFITYQANIYKLFCIKKFDKEPVLISKFKDGEIEILKTGDVIFFKFVSSDNFYISQIIDGKLTKIYDTPFISSNKKLKIKIIDVNGEYFIIEVNESDGNLNVYKLETTLQQKLEEVETTPSLEFNINSDIKKQIQTIYSEIKDTKSRQWFLWNILHSKGINTDLIKSRLGAYLFLNITLPEIHEIQRMIAKPSRLAFFIHHYAKIKFDNVVLANIFREMLNKDTTKRREEFTKIFECLFKIQFNIQFNKFFRNIDPEFKKSITSSFVNILEILFPISDDAIPSLVQIKTIMHSV